MPNWQLILPRELHPLNEQQTGTILAVRTRGQVTLSADSQKTDGEVAIVQNRPRIHRLLDGSVLVGFAGNASHSADLLHLLQVNLATCEGNLAAAIAAVAKTWSRDPHLAKIGEQMIVCDLETTMLVAADGEVLSPRDGIIATGPGAALALASARALSRNTTQDSERIVRNAFETVSMVTVFVNNDIEIATLTECVGSNQTP